MVLILEVWAVGTMSCRVCGIKEMEIIPKGDCFWEIVNLLKLQEWSIYLLSLEYIYFN